MSPRGTREGDMPDNTAIKTITGDDLRNLIGRTGDPIASIFHPTERVAPKPEQNSLHLKTLLGKAEQRLEERGLRKPQALEILAPARALLDDASFWQHQLDGIGV